MTEDVLATQKDSADDNRRQDRFPIALEVHVSLSSEHNFYTGFTDNISEGGLFVATVNVQPIGTRCSFMFTLEPNPEAIQVEGEVRWVREAHADSEMPSGMGIMFRGIQPDAKGRINSFIDKRRDSIFYDDD